MDRDEHHVVPNRNGGWDVVSNSKVVAHADTKEKAEKIARKLSIEGKTELVIHNKEGKIIGSDSHGNDPCPPKDRT